MLPSLKDPNIRVTNPNIRVTNSNIKGSINIKFYIFECFNSLRIKNIFFINRRPRSGRRLYLNPRKDWRINPKKSKKKSKIKSN